MTGRVRISGFLWRHQIWPEALKTEILVLSKIYVLYTIRKEILCWSNVPLEPMSENELEKSYTPSKSVINYWRQSFGQGWRRKHEKSCFFVRKWSYLFVRLIIFDAVFWKWSFKLWANFWYDFWGIIKIFTQESRPVKYSNPSNFDVKTWISHQLTSFYRSWFLCKYIFDTSKIMDGRVLNNFGPFTQKLPSRNRCNLFLVDVGTGGISQTLPKRRDCLLFTSLFPARLGTMPSRIFHV